MEPAASRGGKARMILGAFSRHLGSWSRRPTFAYGPDFVFEETGLLDILP